jgi:hypothetical protein
MYPVIARFLGCIVALVLRLDSGIKLIEIVGVCF